MPLDSTFLPRIEEGPRPVKAPVILVGNLVLKHHSHAIRSHGRSLLAVGSGDLLQKCGSGSTRCPVSLYAGFGNTTAITGYVGGTVSLINNLVDTDELTIADPSTFQFKMDKENMISNILLLTGAQPEGAGRDAGGEIWVGTRTMVKCATLSNLVWPAYNTITSCNGFSGQYIWVYFGAPGWRHMTEFKASPYVCDVNTAIVNPANSAQCICPANTYADSVPVVCKSCPVNSWSNVSPDVSTMTFTPFSPPIGQYSASYSEPGYDLSYISISGSSMGWSPGIAQLPNAYATLDLLTPTSIVAIATAGRADGGINTNSVKVKISNDNVNYITVLESMTTGHDLKITPIQLTARYIRLYPLTYLDRPVLRFGIVQGYSICKCNSGYIYDFSTSSCTACSAGTYYSALTETCVSCSANGYYFDGSACSPCLTGSYCPGNNVVFTCPSGFTSSTGSSDVTQCFCSAGSFLSTLTGNALSFGASSSSQIPGSYGPDQLNDGIKTGGYLFVSNQENNPWIKLDVGTSKRISAGTIWFNNDPAAGASRESQLNTSYRIPLIGLQIYVGDVSSGYISNTLCHTITTSEFLYSPYAHTFNCSVNGKYAWFVLPKISNTLSLHEIELYSSWPVQCNTCPANTYCPSGAISATPCAANLVSRAGSSQCGPKATGNLTINNINASLSKDQFLAALPAGVVINNFQESIILVSKVCPVGYYCPADSTKEIPCPNGTYNGLTNANNVGQCNPCTEGFYCVLASSAPVACPAGTYRGEKRAGQVSDCTVCPSGNYCPIQSVNPTNCTAGTFRAAPGAIQPQDCLACPRAEFCLVATITPTQCAAGTYRGETGATKQDDCATCPSGNYCPIHSVNPTNCSAGTYRAAPGATAPENCLACPRAEFCLIATITPTQCAAGTYRGETGATKQDDCATCPSGNYCPIHSVNPTNCSAGTYRAAPGATQPQDCLACPRAEFCLVATITPTQCAAGTYRGETGATKQDDCTDCPSGNYCPAHAVNPTNCTAGTYRTNSKAIQPQDCLACPRGEFCPIATITPTWCAAGTYRGETGATKQDDCTDCPSGNYCPTHAVNPTNCTAGTYRNASKAIQPSDCIDCPRAQYCPTATTTPTFCDAGTYRGEPKATAQSDCADCPPGNYCPVPSVNPTNCSATKYRTAPKATIESNCLICIIGNYCPLATTTPSLCAGGTYRGETGAAAQADCATCPPGNYCPAGASTPSNCSIGTYRTLPGASDSSLQCLACAYAQYCPILATVTPTDCPAGSYRNVSGAGPVSDCYHCPANYYCQQKSYIPVVCPVNTGSVADSGSLLNCRCLEGYQCTYTKQISATVTLNETKSDFDNDVGGVRTAFLAAIAKAAGVSIADVVINFVSSGNGGRRLLSADMHTDFINVRAMVHGATGLVDLPMHLAVHSPTLHQGHSWEEMHEVVSVKAR